MQQTAAEFVYKLPGVSLGSRPGSHRSRSRGAGMEFATHARLFDQPDPRRIDFRASLNDVRGEWLVRSHYQRSSLTIKAVVDVSASMHFGSKLDLVANFLDALGISAYRSGDSVSLMAFDHRFRDDLFLPAQRARGMGHSMSSRIRASEVNYAATADFQGLDECAERIAGSGGMVFLISDFHWPLDRLAAALDQLSHEFVVPLVVWDQAEIEPPRRGRFLPVYDVESGQYRRLWLRKKIRQQWRDNVDRRRDDISAAFALRDIRPFNIEGRFDAEDLSHYFLEQVA